MGPVAPAPHAGCPPQSLPLLFLALTLALLAVAYRPREIPALLLLPPLALLATPAPSACGGRCECFRFLRHDDLHLLRRHGLGRTVSHGSGMARTAGGQSGRAAPRFRRPIRRPGVLHRRAGDGLVAVAHCDGPRSPYRSLTHWTMGFTTLWLLAIALLLPWVDYGKSYRPVAQAVARHLPDRADCLAERGLNGTQRASFAYFAGLEPWPSPRRPDANAAGSWSGRYPRRTCSTGRRVDPGLGGQSPRRAAGEIPPLPARGMNAYPASGGVSRRKCSR